MNKDEEKLMDATHNFCIQFLPRTGMDIHKVASLLFLAIDQAHSRCLLYAKGTSLHLSSKQIEAARTLDSALEEFYKSKKKQKAQDIRKDMCDLVVRARNDVENAMKP